MKLLINSIFIFGFFYCYSQDTIQFSYPDTNKYLKVHTYESMEEIDFLKVKKDGFYIYNWENTKYTFNVKHNQTIINYNSSWLDYSASGNFKNFIKTGNWYYYNDYILERETIYSGKDTIYNSYGYNDKKRCLTKNNNCYKKTTNKVFKNVKSALKTQNFRIQHHIIGFTNKEASLIYKFETISVIDDKQAFKLNLYITLKNTSLNNKTSRGLTTHLLTTTNNHKIWISYQKEKLPKIDKTKNNLISSLKKQLGEF